MAKTIKDLLLALLNATLILVALCLFLGWKFAETIEGVQDRLAQSLAVVQPLKEQAQGLRAEVGTLREDLATIKAGTGDDPELDQKLSQALTRLDSLQDRLEATQDKLGDVAENPELLIDFAVTTAVDAATQRVLRLRGCGERT
ncbi:conserved hypothetical protein [Ruegeria lacuscaerulensis ITI-1157]|nr:conserved hypothetical protein [Ruegeria lacuscaerulensis ITI-1157]SHJ12535.1 hypothetical protein SAMN05444404_1481 [Ruegeria lacuscaerulensis ITI-1157]